MTSIFGGNLLSPASGTRKKRTRVGRGEGSGLGKTCGRGGKGQTARGRGKVAAHFEGGQMPLYRRIPKLGFRSLSDKRGRGVFHVISLSDLQKYVEDNGASEVIDGRNVGSRGRPFDPRVHTGGVKVLSNGSISSAVKVVVDAWSQSAGKAIRDAGGSVTNRDDEAALV